MALNWRLLIYSEWISTFIYLSLEYRIDTTAFSLVCKALRNMEKWMDWKWNWDTYNTVVNNGIACGCCPGHHPRKLTTKTNWNRIFHLSQMNFRFSSILQYENILICFHVLSTHVSMNISFSSLNHSYNFPYWCIRCKIEIACDR